LAFDHDRFQPDHYVSGLLRMRARTDFQVYIGGRYTQLLEERFGHIEVIVLAGVDEWLHHVLSLLQST
jgi:hypothetical protein